MRFEAGQGSLRQIDHLVDLCLSSRLLQEDEREENLR